MTVYLVGAGPGDPGLMTARALELIAAADVIVYDRLIPASALEGARPDATLIYAGKEGGGPSMPQSEISGLLVAHGAAGEMVVRLKGGDPFVFGRGGEEAEALVAAGVPFEVVPGVTAGVAGPPTPASPSPTGMRRARSRSSPATRTRRSRSRRWIGGRWRRSRGRSCSTWAFASCRRSRRLWSVAVVRRPSRRPWSSGGRCPISGSSWARFRRLRRWRLIRASAHLRSWSWARSRGCGSGWRGSSRGRSRGFLWR